MKVTRFLYKSLNVGLDGFVTSISTKKVKVRNLHITYNLFGSQFFFYFTTPFYIGIVKLRNVLPNNVILYFNSLLYLT